MPSIKPKIVVRTEEDIIKKFNFIANSNNRSMSNQAETLIINFIKEYESIHGEIPLEVPAIKETTDIKQVNIKKVKMKDNNGTINM